MDPFNLTARQWLRARNQRAFIGFVRAQIRLLRPKRGNGDWVGSGLLGRVPKKISKKKFLLRLSLSLLPPHHLLLPLSKGAEFPLPSLDMVRGGALQPVDHAFDHFVANRGLQTVTGWTCLAN